MNSNKMTTENIVDLNHCSKLIVLTLSLLLNGKEFDSYEQFRDIPSIKAYTDKYQYEITEYNYSYILSSAVKSMMTFHPMYILPSTLLSEVQRTSGAAFITTLGLQNDIKQFHISNIMYTSPAIPLDDEIDFLTWSKSITDIIAHRCQVNYERRSKLTVTPGISKSGVLAFQASILSLITLLHNMKL